MLVLERLETSAKNLEIDGSVGEEDMLHEVAGSVLSRTGETGDGVRRMGDTAAMFAERNENSKRFRLATSSLLQNQPV